MITAYLNFNGNTEEVFNFYKTAFGGEISSLQRFGDTPHGDQMSDADKKKIMHIRMESPIGVTLMGSDFMDFMGRPFIAGNNFSLSLHPESETQADELFTKLSEDGSVTMPLAKVFWGAYFGMFTDKYGIQWLVNYEYK
ncbi:VOC family protein [Flavitalea sp.]|nr:VOC family protein [Flavitalea sp.]